MICTLAPPNVMPPLLLCWTMKPEADIGDMVDEPTCQSIIFFSHFL